MMLHVYVSAEGRAQQTQSKPETVCTCVHKVQDQNCGCLSKGIERERRLFCTSTKFFVFVLTNKSNNSSSNGFSGKRDVAVGGSANTLLNLCLKPYVRTFPKRKRWAAGEGSAQHGLCCAGKRPEDFAPDGCSCGVTLFYVYNYNLPPFVSDSVPWELLY